MVSINTNIAANIAARNIYDTRSDLEGSLSKLSSGSRIVKSSDDAGGMAVSMKMDAQELQLSALEKNLTNSLSFLETQEGALRILSQILSRISELEALKVDVTKNKGDIENYDKEIKNLQSEIVKIREEKFNGVRLFSPDKTADSIQVDGFPLNNSVIDISRPPLPTVLPVNRLELVFLVDATGSMSSTWNDIRNAIENFINNLPSNITSWSAKVEAFGEYSAYSSDSFLSTNSFTSDIATLKSQVPTSSMSSNTATGEESPIDAIGLSLKNANWPTTSAKRGMILFSDFGSPVPTGNYGSSSDIAKSVINNNVDLTIFSQKSDPEISSFSSSAGADLNDLSSISNMEETLRNWVAELASDGPKLDDLSDWMAQNGASQSAIRNLVDSVKINRQNLNMANSRIIDVDIGFFATFSGKQGFLACQR